MSIKKIFIPIFLSAGTIFAFIFSFNKTNSSVSNNKTTSSNLESTSKKIDNLTSTNSSNPQQLQKLSVLPLRCIGCGKCVRTDSFHFEMNYSTGKAIVISSTNLNSQKLAAAINICPVQAITLQ